MHDELFEQPAVVARYRAGPYAESRERFLREARADGYSPATLESMAWALLVVAEAVHRDGGSISYQRLRSTLLRRIRLKSTARPPSANTAKLFLRCAKAWLRSTGALTPEAERPLKFAAELRAFTRYMQFEQGLSPTTIRSRRADALVLCFIAVSGAIAWCGDSCRRRRIPDGSGSAWMEPQVFAHARR